MAEDHVSACVHEFSRPSEEDERRALAWLCDRRDWDEHSPLERRYAATLIQTLAWFEELERATRRIAAWTINETEPCADDFADVKRFATEALVGSPVEARDRG